MQADTLEKYSSAMTLSDMEIFVFPELMYALVLANIMSPEIWKWRDQDCFRKLEGKSAWRKLLRLRQYIMDEYDFNLDLETWGLTTRDRELARFASFISPEDIAASNALFGYQGDRYYFDVDIRRHFGLDKYDSDIIPYWKTETVEAMNAFPLRPGYTRKAGECVSLAALYAAAAFIVCGIPLEDIYMILTPLHSQNFLDIGDGALTNNRRVLTKAMWFNGTEITYKAQRALRHEQVTIVAHSTGHIHCLYEEATIEPAAYERFIKKLHGFLATGFDSPVFANFLRAHSRWQKHFIFCHHVHGVEKWVNASTLFAYEHDSDNRVGDATFDRLFDEVSEDDFESVKPDDRVCFEEFVRHMKRAKTDLRNPRSRAALAERLKPYIPESDKFAEELSGFLGMTPRLPSPQKKYLPSRPVEIAPRMSREEIVEYLRAARAWSTVADLAFYAWRDMETCDWLPFVKAAVERNPVSLEMTGGKSPQEVYEWLQGLSDASIYSGKRLAQPDEVANFRSGDGLEKAFVLANVLRARQPQQAIELAARQDQVLLKAAREYAFPSAKGLKKTVTIAPDGKYSAA